MIAFMLLFPVLASIILFIVKSRALNIITLLSYAFVYLCLSVKLAIKPDGFTPYFAVDNLNILFLLVLAVLFFGVALYSVEYFRHKAVSKVWHTLYVIFVILFISAMTGAILSTHLGLLWVFIEATTIVSAPLIYFEKTKYSLEATWKYIFICSIGIALAFVGIILLSIAGVSLDSLFFADLYSKHQHVSLFWLKLAYIFIVIGFGTKIGLAPVHAWLPDAYSEAPSAIAVLSGALLNAAFLVILRVYKLMVLASLEKYAGMILIVMGLLSLFVSTVFIIKVKNYKRMLAYSSIENMGLMAIGVGCGGVGIFAALLHMVGSSLTKGSFFLCTGNVWHRYGAKRWDEVSGIMKKDPVLAYLLLFSMLSIVGLPPFSTFISEFFIFKALFDGKHYVLIAAIFVLMTVIMYGLGSAVIRMCLLSNITENNAPEHNKEISFFGIFPQVMFILILIIAGVYMPKTLYSLINNAWSN